MCRLFADESDVYSLQVKTTWSGVSDSEQQTASWTCPQSSITPSAAADSHDECFYIVIWKIISTKCWLKPLEGRRLWCRMWYLCVAPSLNLKIRNSDQTFVRKISVISLNSRLLLFLLAATPRRSSLLISFHLPLSLIWDQFCSFSPLKLKRGLAGHVTRLVPQISLRVLSSFTNSTPAVVTLILPDDCVTSPTAGLPCDTQLHTHITMLPWPTEAEALERY